MSSAKAAARYVKQGWVPVPVPSGAKSPGRDGWQDLRIGLEDVPTYFTNGQNIGIHCGEPSGWLVCVDLDTPEALELAGRFLPTTLTSGRDSTPAAHWWFTCPGAEHKVFHRFEDTKPILEIRSTGHHTLVFPSKHPSGEQYRWGAGGHVVTKVAREDLQRCCRELASAALIAQALPKTSSEGGGGRHDLALALAGFMLRRGLDEGTVLGILVGAGMRRGTGAPKGPPGRAQRPRSPRGRHLGSSER